MQIVVGRGGNDQPEELLIFDAGTGIRALGKEIAERTRSPAAIHIFLTHFHWDHVQGLPYFRPLYAAASKVVFHSAHGPEELSAVLAGQMRGPYFPLLFDELPAQVEFRRIGAEPVRFGSVTVEAFPLHHPQGSVGYRIVDSGRTAVYATDHEHGDAASDHGLIAMAKNADVLVYDAQYTPVEYATRQGWGHSTWLEAARIAEQAGVRQLVLFHHDPDRDDEAVRGIEDEARREFAATVAAHEGLVL